jgi:osmoprotectant transport system ATP-binding protein
LLVALQRVETPVLDFRGVSYQVGGRAILREIHLQVHPGETVVLLGRSGCGKTTLLKTVNRMLQPTSGEIRLDGKSLLDSDPIHLRRGIGYVIQDGGLFPHWTVARNIGLVLQLEGRPETAIRDRATSLMKVMGLAPELAGRYPRQLSGGEKQRVGIARALAAEPRLLLMDEPFAALDPVTRFELQQHFVRLREEFGTTAIFVTHDVREALLIGSRIAVMQGGRIETVLPAGEFRSATTPEASAFLASIRSAS